MGVCRVLDRVEKMLSGGHTAREMAQAEVFLL